MKRLEDLSKEKLEEIFNDPELIEGFAKEMAMKHKLKEAFFESKDFDSVLEKIRKAEHISQYGWEDGEESYGISKDEFKDVCESIFYKVGLKTKSEGKFPVDSVDYKGIEFGILYGQGTIYYAKTKK